jgi:hypothetical protein
VVLQVLAEVDLMQAGNNNDKSSCLNVDFHAILELIAYTDVHQDEAFGWQS